MKTGHPDIHLVAGWVAVVGPTLDGGREENPEAEWQHTHHNFVFRSNINEYHH